MQHHVMEAPMHSPRSLGSALWPAGLCLAAPVPPAVAGPPVGLGGQAPARAHIHVEVHLGNGGTAPVAPEAPAKRVLFVHPHVAPSDLSAGRRG